MRNTIATAVLFVSAALPSFATANECPEYASQSGTEIQFNTGEVLQEYGFQMFHSTANPSRGTPYEKLAGKRAKITGKTSDQHKILHFHEVLVEDCTRLFWLDTDGTLDAGDALPGNVTFVTRPSTIWKAAERVDRLTDEKSCVVSPEARMPFPAFHFTRQSASAGVVGGDFPGRPVTFRVDRNAPIEGIEVLSGAGIETLISQVRRGGGTLLVGSYEWPKDYQVISEFNVEGLAEKLEYCRKAVGE